MQRYVRLRPSIEKQEQQATNRNVENILAESELPPLSVECTGCLRRVENDVRCAVAQLISSCNYVRHFGAVGGAGG